MSSVEAMPGTSTTARAQCRGDHQGRRTSRRYCRGRPYDLDVLALCEFDDQRNHAAMRQVGALEDFSDFDQDQFGGQVDGSQMGADQIEIVSRRAPT